MRRQFNGNFSSCLSIQERAFYINHQWVADLMAFTSRPAKGKDGTYTHVLLVQDIFSRFLWATPLKSVTETTEAFKAILNDGIPDGLDTDGGPEFANHAFGATDKAL